MKLHDYPESDSLYIELNPNPSSDSRIIAEGVVADFDEHGRLVGIDIDHAADRLDLRTLETVSLPAATKVS